jgi:creatinine amidohydrolase
MEAFPWTRLRGIELPDGKKPPTPRTDDDPAAVRAELGDGSFGGYWQRPDVDVVRVWDTGVKETRDVLESLRAGASPSPSG